MCVPYVIAILLSFLVGLIFIFIRKLRIVGVSLVLLAIMASAYAIWQTRHYEQNFPLVALGDSQQHVRELLGRPANITDGTKAEYGLPRSTSEIHSNVVAEFWYYCVYAPRVWVVSFDKDLKVIKKGELNSP